MGFNHSPKIVTDGLALLLDAANPKSYPGSGTVWRDISGNGNHCTLWNSPTFDNGVFILDGANDYFRTTTSLDLTGTNAVTIMYFMKVLSYTTIKIIHEFSSNYNTGNDVFVASYCDSSTGVTEKIFSALKGNSGYNIGIYDESMLNDLEWHHLTFIHDTSQSSTENLIYGESTPGTVFENPRTGYSANNTNNFGNQVLYFGCRGGSNYFADMEVGQVIMYNRALSASEIQQNYNALKGRFGL